MNICAHLLVNNVIKPLKFMSAFSSLLGNTFIAPVNKWLSFIVFVYEGIFWFCCFVFFLNSLKNLFNFLNMDSFCSVSFPFKD